MSAEIKQNIYCRLSPPEDMGFSFDGVNNIIRARKEVIIKIINTGNYFREFTYYIGSFSLDSASCFYIDYTANGYKAYGFCAEYIFPNDTHKELNYGQLLICLNKLAYIVEEKKTFVSKFPAKSVSIRSSIIVSIK